jgi:hypothetical protein
MDWGNGVTYFGKTAFKEGVVPFGIKDEDRLGHLSVIGKLGSGRAALITNMALQDTERGMSVVVLDASGNLAPMIAERLGEAARERLVLLDPSDGEHPFSWNPIDEFLQLRERTVPVLSEAFASVYNIQPSSITESIAQAAVGHRDATILMLYNAVTDMKVRDELFRAGMPERARFDRALEAEKAAISLIIEHGRYLAKDTLMRNLLGQVESKFSLAQGNAGALVIVDLSRIRMFPTRIAPLVRIFTHAARARAVLGERVALYLYDSVKHLPPGDVELIFPEKSLAFTIASIPSSEEEKEGREQAFGRCASVVTFALNPPDFSLAEKTFYPYVSPEDLSKLKESETCVTLSIDSVRARPFFAIALPLRARSSGVSLQDLKTLSQSKYTITRIKADQLFRPKPDKDGKNSGKDGDPGSFSDAFRSIFTKRAGAAPVPASGPAPLPTPAPNAPKEPEVKKQPVSPAPAQKEQPQNKPQEKKITPFADKGNGSVKQSEIPEEDLRRMVYVDPVIEFGIAT